MTQKIKILFLASNPRDTSRLAIDDELRKLKLRLRESGAEGRFDVQPELALRPHELSAALMRHKPDIVHFSGHGTRDGALCLIDDATGGTREVSTEQVVDIFKALGGGIRCVVLSACYSAAQAQALVKVVPCVVGMSRAVKDESAIAFAAGFYQALAFEKSVRTAFEVGCAEIGLLTRPNGSESASLDLESRSLRKQPEAGKTQSLEKEIPQLLTAQGVDAAKLVLLEPPIKANPWAVAVSAPPPPAAVPAGAASITQQQSTGNITITQGSNRTTVNQNNDFTRGGVPRGVSVDQKQQVGDVLIDARDNVTAISQGDTYGRSGNEEAAEPTLLQQARTLLAGLTDSITNSQLSSLQKKHLAVTINDLKEQLGSASLDRSVLSEAMEDLGQKLAAAPALKSQVETLSGVIDRLQG